MAYDPENTFEYEIRGTYKELNIDDIDTDHEFWIGNKDYCNTLFRMEIYIKTVN